MGALTYTLPSELDGEPAEVRDKALAQLVKAAELYQQLASQTAIQVRNAGLTDAERHAADGANLNEVYETRRPKEAALVELLSVRAGDPARIARSIKRAAQEYDEDPDAGVLG